jgi:hypothetical protein
MRKMFDAVHFDHILFLLLPPLRSWEDAAKFKDSPWFDLLVSSLLFSSLLFSSLFSSLLFSSLLSSPLLSSPSPSPPPPSLSVPVCL